MILYLIRHGQTAWNIERRFLGTTDIPLDEEGLRQASCLKKAFPDCTGWSLWSSPLKRALQTAWILGEPRLHPGLQELAMGALEGLDREGIEVKWPGLLQQWFTDPVHFRAPSGETLPELQERAWAALQDIQKSSKSPLAIISHQLTITSLLCRITQTPLSEFRTFSHTNTAFSTLRLEHGSWELLAQNQSPHLL
jgi:broad specificity phosphatase PhoE